MTPNITSLAIWALPAANNQVVRGESDSWNGVFKLVLLSAIATGGTMGGVFVISAVTVMEPFRVRGNIFLVNLAMGHLLVTGIVLPTSCVLLLASLPQDQPVCTFQWLVTVTCLLISVLSFLFMAIENLSGLGNAVTYDLCCTKARILTTVALIWIVSVGFSLGQYHMEYGPTFCYKDSRVWIPYHLTLGVVLIGVPVLITAVTFATAVFKLRTFKQQLETLEDPTAYTLTDEALLKSNIVVFVFMLLMWTPFAVVATTSVLRDVTINLMNPVWWLALSNSCLYSYVYAATNRDFREAFSKLFYYCCCKSHVTFSRRSRDGRRCGDGVGLRVHIIPGLNIYAQRKETCKDSYGGSKSYEL